MRNFAVLTMLGFILSAAPAFAETMDATFGNTVTVTRPDGTVDSYFFEPDGSFVERSHDGHDYAGHWVRSGDSVCLTLPGHDGQDCAPFPLDKKLGDSWLLDSGGGSATITLVAGRATRPS